MNYKDIVKRLKGFDFSKKQKENLADIISGGINTFEIGIEPNDESYVIIVDGERFVTRVSPGNTESNIELYIDSRRLYTKLKYSVYYKKRFIIANISNGGYTSNILCQTLWECSAMSIIIPMAVIVSIRVSNTD